MNVEGKPETVLWALVIAVLALAAMFELKTAMIGLGAAIHDIHCRDHTG